MLTQDEKISELKTITSTVSSRAKINPELYNKYNVKRGLRNNDGTGVLVGLTEVGEVMSYIVDDAERVPVEGKLFYRGYDVKELVKGFYGKGRFGYEEIAFLLITGELPTEEEYKKFTSLLQSCRDLPENFTEDMILKAPSPDIMNKLARTVLALYTYDPDPDSVKVDNVVRQCIELIARFPVLISYAYMARRHYIDGKSLYIRKPNPEYSTAENILYLIRKDGKFTDLEAKILDLCLVLHAEHGGGNNSSFVTHAVSSTGADTYAVMAAAIGSLKGPQHGGASNKAYLMMQDMMANITDYKDESQVYDYLARIIRKDAFDKSGLIYGIGHAVYTLSDPRTKTLCEYARELSVKTGKEDVFDLYQMVERIAPKVFADIKKSDKIVCANVDFYAGFIYSMLGIPPVLFIPLFACARVAGWSAHRIEELISGGRIMRPAYKCVNKRRPYIEMSDR